jgi:cell division protein FtsA
MSENQLQYFVGLDIGTTAVRCVVGELGSDASIPTVIGFSRVENTGMRKGMVAISSIDRQISLEDRMRVEEAATVVQLPPNKEIIQVFAKNYRLDGQENIKDPVGMHGVRLEVDTHIVVASTPALKSLEQALERAELRASHRTITSLAAGEATLDRKQKESGVCILDIGAATTNLLVIEDGEVEHVAVIPMGGTHVTNDLAIGLKTELGIAELIKLKHASLSKGSIGETSFVVKGEEFRFDREMMRMIVEARVEEILEYADKELKRIHRSRKLPGGIVLVGGTSKLPGLVELTKDVMELPARVGHFKHISRVVDGMDEHEFGPAVGLMLLDMYLGPASDISFVAWIL